MSLSTNSKNFSMDDIASNSEKSSQKEALNLNKIDALFAPLKLGGEKHVNIFENNDLEYSK